MNADHFADTEWNDVIEADTASPDMPSEEQWTCCDALWDAYNA